MSHYSCVEIELRDGAALVAALNRLGFEGKVEVHDTAQGLYGYHNDLRPERADIIIRRQHVGYASNDIGFERQTDGTYRAWISEYDGRQGHYDQTWLSQLKQYYATAKAKTEAKKRGYMVKETIMSDGKIRLKLTR